MWTGAPYPILIWNHANHIVQEHIRSSAGSGGRLHVWQPLRNKKISLCTAFDMHAAEVPDVPLCTTVMAGAIWLHSRMLISQPLSWYQHALLVNLVILDTTAVPWGPANLSPQIIAGQGFIVRVPAIVGMLWLTIAQSSLDPVRGVCFGEPLWIQTLSVVCVW